MNVKGLNVQGKIKKFQSYLCSINQKIDFLMIQEHKLVGDKAAELGRTLDC